MNLTASLGGIALAFVLGAAAGHQFTSDHYAAKQAQAVAGAAERLRKSVAAGEAATEDLREQLRTQGLHTARLVERTAHAQLTVPSKCAPAVARTAAPAGPGGPGPGLALSAAAGAAGAVHDAPRVDRLGAAPGAVEGTGLAEEAAAGDDGIRLTVGAVRLWNSALAGVDVSTGACGIAGASASACDADAGLDINDAWVNHAINAASCAEDRARYRSLIDFLRSERP